MSDEALALQIQEERNSRIGGLRIFWARSYVKLTLNESLFQTQLMRLDRDTATETKKTPTSFLYKTKESSI